MKMEIWLNIFSLILLIPLSKVFSENPFLRWTMMMVFFFIIFFFTFKFYLFYIKTKDYSIDTLNNLLEIKFELRTLKELYNIAEEHPDIVQELTMLANAHKASLKIAKSIFDQK